MKVKKLNSPQPALIITTRVSEDEKRIIGAAASLSGENVSEFVRRVVAPAASRTMAEYAKGKSAEGK